MVIALVLFTVFKQFDGRVTTSETVTYTQFMDDARAGRISKVDIQGDTLHVTPESGRPYTLTSPAGAGQVGCAGFRQSPGRALVPCQCVYLLVPHATVNRGMDFLHAPNARWRQGWCVQFR